MSESNHSSSSTAYELSAELLQICMSDSLSLSEEGLRTIIEKYGLTPDNNMHGVDDFDLYFFHEACDNEFVTEEIIRLLIEYFPGAPGLIDYDCGGSTPLHTACGNKHMTANIVQLLIEAAPESVRHTDAEGDLPLHVLSSNEDIDEMVALNILKLLLEKCPESIRHTNNVGELPLHCAASSMSPRFCQSLIESYPESLRVSTENAELPLHHACMYTNFLAVKSLYKLHPDALHHTTSEGNYPIHDAIMGLLSSGGRKNPKAAVNTLKFLLDCDPRVKLQKYGDTGGSLLHFACGQDYDDSNVEAIVQMIEAICGALPESLRSPDENGQLPIHCLCYRATQEIEDEKVARKILELLLEKYPEATQHIDDNGNLPLHCACGKRSTEFCQLLIESYPDSVRVSNITGILPLHYACHDNTLSTVEYLYKLYPDAVHNAATNGEYPIHCAIKSLQIRKERDNPKAAVDIVKYLLECDPRVKVQEYAGESLLHFAFMEGFDDSNVDASVQMIETIYDSHPASLRSLNESGQLPIHYLCHCDTQEIEGEKEARKILELLLEKYPASTQHIDNNGNLPLHCACGKRSPEFCQLLIESYPDSVRVSSNDGVLPLHYACYGNTLSTVEYLYKLYPDAVHSATTGGQFPVHVAIQGLMGSERNHPKAAVDIVKFLLDCDPRVKLQKFGVFSSLHFACKQDYKDSTIEAGLQMIQAIYDEHPESILGNHFTPDVQQMCEEIQVFINNEMFYAHQARAHRLMTTPDENGQLPLHRALRNNLRLGSIKLLLKGNRSAPNNADSNHSLPLHLACEYHYSPRVIEHLIDLYPTTIRCLDFDQNNVLHYACRGANYIAIALLLDKYDASSVSMRNAHNELPMDLLFKSSAVEGRESIEYVDCVYRLLRAYPVTLL